VCFWTGTDSRDIKTQSKKVYSINGKESIIKRNTKVLQSSLTWNM